MRTVLIALLATLRTLLIDYLTSKKVLTAILTSLAAAFIPDAVIRDRVVAAGLALLGMQGLADVGKAGAQLKADAMVNSGIGQPLVLTRTPTEPGGVAVSVPLSDSYRSVTHPGSTR
jgi:hypothetical protein